MGKGGGRVNGRRMREEGKDEIVGKKQKRAERSCEGKRREIMKGNRERNDRKGNERRSRKEV